MALALWVQCQFLGGLFLLLQPSGRIGLGPQAHLAEFAATADVVAAISVAAGIRIGAAAAMRMVSVSAILTPMMAMMIAIIALLLLLLLLLIMMILVMMRMLLLALVMRLLIL